MNLRTGVTQPRRGAFLACLLAGLLSGCGFQLRGTSPVPQAVQPLALTCAPAIPAQLCEAVRSDLRQGGVDLVSSAQADYLLRLNEFREERKVSAITMEAAAAEFDLRQTLRMDVITSDQVPLTAEVQINSSETFRHSETSVLAAQREEHDLRQVLYQRLAQQVVFRLSPLTRPRIRALRADSVKPAQGGGTP